MEPEVWSAAFAGVAVVVAGVSVVIATRANARADTANKHADAANKIAHDANQLSIEANDTAQQALAIEERRDRAAVRPVLDVRPGEGHNPRGTFDATVGHDGTQTLDHVLLRVTQPKVAMFFPGMEPFIAQGGSPLPQDEVHDLGSLGAGEVIPPQLLWRDFSERTMTIVSEIRFGDDIWEQRHDLVLDDDCRFESAVAPVGLMVQVVRRRVGGGAAGAAASGVVAPWVIRRPGGLQTARQRPPGAPRGARWS